MIVPLADETVRIEFLADARPWQPSERPVLVVAPHRDDETLGAGGLIAAQRSRGIEVRVVAVTNGEMAYGTLCLAKTSYTCKMNDLAKSSIRTFPI